MSAFFAEVLDDFIKPAFMEKVRIKYHYEETAKGRLLETAGKMLPLMRREAFWERLEFQTGEWKQAEMPGAAYERVAMTLGQGLDRLQDEYSRKGCLTECYMTEALASEILTEGYRAYNRYMKENTPWHVARYYFPGSEELFPLKMLPHILKGFSLGMSCNEACCIQPKKSVVFVAELTGDASVQCEGICVNCRRIHCPNRILEDTMVERRIADIPLPYGYKRIFGIQ